MKDGCGKAFHPKELNRGWIQCGKQYTFGKHLCPNCIKANGIKTQLCDGWRDCRKELPDIDIHILLFLNNGEYRIGKFAGKAYGFKTSSGDYLGNEHPMDFKANSAPKAWMPLPDPPAFA